MKKKEKKYKYDWKNYKKPKELKLKDMTKSQLEEYKYCMSKLWYHKNSKKVLAQTKEARLAYQKSHRKEISAKYRNYHQKRRVENPDYYRATSKKFYDKKRSEQQEFLNTIKNRKTPRTEVEQIGLIIMDYFKFLNKKK